MQEYKINETIILGIDHGYGNIKTRHTVTRTDVKKQDGKPVFSKNYVEYNGAFYIVGEGHKSFIPDKQDDMDYYILTLAAIAKELRQRELTNARIFLAVGLPLKWVQSQRESFRDYLMRDRHIQFRFADIEYDVYIEGCEVFPQCYSAVAENLREYTGINLLVDVGNGTMNVLYLNNGKVAESRAWTEKFGVSQCAQRIRNKIMDKTGEMVPDDAIDDYLKTGATDIAEPYVSLMKKAATEYVDEIFQRIKQYEFNDKMMKLYFMGGGAKIVRAVGTYDEDRTFFDHDICSTAKGYEYFCYMKLRHNNK